MSRCDLFLENYENEYTDGDQIIGYLQCTFVNEKVITGMSVTFHGELNTYWYSQKMNRHLTSHYTAKEVILHVKIQLIDCEGYITIPTGTHRYPFNYTLPRNIPSTFQAGMGDVKYTVKGLVSRLWFQRDYKANTKINIVCPMDLNHKPNLRQQCTLKEVNDVWSVIHYVRWEKLPLSSEFRLPYSGFVPGENVPIDFVIRNFTNTTVRKVKFSILYKQNFVFTAPIRAEKNFTQTIAKLKVRGVGPFHERYYNEVLKIPIDFKPPNFDCSEIINTSYLLQAEIFLPSFTPNIKISHSITIGNIPLRNLDSIGNDEHSITIGNIPLRNLDSIGNDEHSITIGNIPLRNLDSIGNDEHSITIGNIPLRNLDSIGNDEPPAYNNLDGLFSVVPSRELPEMPDPFPLTRRVYWEHPFNHTSNNDNQLPSYDEAVSMITRN